MLKLYNKVYIPLNKAQFAIRVYVLTIYELDVNIHVARTYFFNVEHSLLVWLLTNQFSEIDENLTIDKIGLPVKLPSLVNYIVDKIIGDFNFL